MKVLIDNVVYVPRDETIMTEEARKLLADVYGVLWLEAYYDPNNEQSREFALKHVGKMERLNELLKFKE